MFGMSGAVDIINSTLGKALGGAAGGYTVGPKELTTLLRQRSRPYLFSNSLPPPVVAGAVKVGVAGFIEYYTVFNSLPKYIGVEECRGTLFDPFVI